MVVLGPPRHAETPRRVLLPAPGQNRAALPGAALRALALRDGAGPAWNGRRLWLSSVHQLMTFPGKILDKRRCLADLSLRQLLTFPLE